MIFTVMRNSAHIADTKFRKGSERILDTAQLLKTSLVHHMKTNQEKLLKTLYPGTLETLIMNNPNRSVQIILFPSILVNQFKFFLPERPFAGLRHFFHIAS